MLKLFSGLMAMICKSSSHTHYAAPLPPMKSSASKWADHSRLRGAFGRCMCRKCHLVRATEDAPRKVADAIKRCHAKLEELDRTRDDIVLRGDEGAGPPDRSIDWNALADESCEATMANESCETPNGNEWTTHKVYYSISGRPLEKPPHPVETEQEISECKRIDAEMASKQRIEKAAASAAAKAEPGWDDRSPGAIRSGAPSTSA